LTRDSPEQKALSRRLARECGLAGIVVSRNIPRRRPRDYNRILFNRAAGRIVGRCFIHAWHEMLAWYENQRLDWCDAAKITVPNVNSPETLTFLETCGADLVLVSSTNLVGRAVIERAHASRGILNLHTGLAPYVRGGPNCTNWCLSEDTLELIGNTVLWLDPGIDSGPLLATERTTLRGDETLSQLQIAVHQHAHDLYARSLRSVLEAKGVPRISQASVSPGRTFLTREWGPSAMLRARRNYRRRFVLGFQSSPSYLAASKGVRLFPLESV
jgi:hypothetical protein